MSHLNILESDVPNSKPSCFIALLLNIDYVILKNSVAVPKGMMNILLPTQYQFVSVVCHVYWTDTPFWFLYANLC